MEDQVKLLIKYHLLKDEYEHLQARCAEHWRKRRDGPDDLEEELLTKYIELSQHREKMREAL